MKRTELKRRTPLRSKAAKKKRTTSPRCDTRGCTRRAEVEIAGEWHELPDEPLIIPGNWTAEVEGDLSGTRVRLLERFCKPHAKKEADKLFARAVKYRDGYRCQRCGRTDREGVVVECAHVIRRGALSIRWDLDNALTLCKEHHVFYTYREEEWRTWLDLNYPGLWDRLNLIRLTAIATGSKPDLAEIIASLRSQASGLVR